MLMDVYQQNQLRLMQFPHVNQDVVINQDLKKLLSNYHLSKNKRCFSNPLDTQKQLASIFALLCSEPMILDISVLGEDYFAQRGETVLASRFHLVVQQFTNVFM